MSGLEGLSGTPQRIASPSATESPTVTSQPTGNNLDDLMGLSNGFASQSNGHEDVLGGFGGLDLHATSQPLPPKQQLSAQASGKKTNEDLLSLF